MYVYFIGEDTTIGKGILFRFVVKSDHHKRRKIIIDSELQEEHNLVFDDSKNGASETKIC